jgi:hypothetical protein
MKFAAKIAKLMFSGNFERAGVGTFMKREEGGGNLAFVLWSEVGWNWQVSGV